MPSNEEPSASSEFPGLVLIPHRPDGTLYVRELGRAYHSLGWKVVFCAENLLQAAIQPDLVHLQWPEAFYRWMDDDTPERQGENLLEALDKAKRGGAKIVWTVHNITPHENASSSLDARIYQGIIERADLIVHHCPASIELLDRAYRVPRGTPSIVAPIGNYVAYPSQITRNEARKSLEIPTDAF